jgi:hypothetical protein
MDSRLPAIASDFQPVSLPQLNPIGFINSLGGHQMIDFENLGDRQKAWLQIKLDGYIEAAVQAGRLHNLGLSEALSLTMLAVAREFAAHAVKREKADAIWAAAIRETYPAAIERNARAVN